MILLILMFEVVYNLMMNVLCEILIEFDIFIGVVVECVMWVLYIIYELL